MNYRQTAILPIIFTLVVLISLLITITNFSIGLPYPQKFNLGLAEDVVHRLVYEISRDLEVIRGLRFIKPIDIKIINTSWAIETWAPKEDFEIPKEILYREMVYKLTFLIPYNKTIIQLQRAWVGMFLAAVAGTTLYINTDYFNPYDSSARNVLAHELTHILQFLHFQMNPPATLDENLAFLTLLEGDAGWTQHLYCNKTKLCVPSPSTRLRLDDLYIALQLFPYIYGENFVRYLYELRGWDLVNKAYKKPPRSTLMILNPEYYLNYLLNGTDIVVETTITLNGISECVYSDTLGSYYIMLILARDIGIEKASDIALNWRGDRVELCRAVDISEIEWIVLWNITWSSPTYAKYFYNNLTLILTQKANVVEVDEGRMLAVIGVSESMKHVIVVEVHGINVFIKSKYISIEQQKPICS